MHRKLPKINTEAIYTTSQKTMQKPNNIAYIDGQNLRLGTMSSGRKVDLKKFRIYLRDKYHIQEAHYFLGFVSDNEQELYSSIQKAGFILNFREHSSALKGKKKGNVDVDIVFEVMKRITEFYFKIAH